MGWGLHNTRASCATGVPIRIRAVLSMGAVQVSLSRGLFHGECRNEVAQ